MEAGRLELVAADFDLATVVDNVTVLWRRAPGRRTCHLETRIADDVPRALSGDAGRLRQVLLNLVGERHQVHGPRRGARRGRPTSAPRTVARGCGSRSSTPGSGSRRRPRSACSRSSARSICPPHAVSAAPDSAWRSPSGSSPPWADRSGCRARAGHGSTFWFEVALPPASEDNRAARAASPRRGAAAAHPARRGQPGEPAGGARPPPTAGASRSRSSPTAGRPSRPCGRARGTSCSWTCTCRSWMAARRPARSAACPGSAAACRSSPCRRA